MNYEYILFDLDGTLTDPKLGITKSVAYALKSYGIEVEDLDSLLKFIGPPLKDSFIKYYGFSEEQGAEAVERYREYFKPYGIYENKVYDGVENMLSKLLKCGKKVILATSKPTVFANVILEHFNLKQYFTCVVGSELDGSRVKKGEVVAEALRQAGVTNKSAAVMVGDREHDIFGARENGIDSVGVLYGYGNRAELETAGAGYIVESVEELFECLLHT